MRLSQFAFGIFAILFLSCRYDHAQVVPVPETCDTLHPSYNVCVQPILKANCYECHSDSASQHGQASLDLEDFTLFKNYLLNHYQGDTIYGSKFMAVIGYRPLVLHMPPTAQLPQEEIRVIDKWIANGAPAN